jgi:hypothetical protein
VPEFMGTGIPVSAASAGIATLQGKTLTINKRLRYILRAPSGSGHYVAVQGWCHTIFTKLKIFSSQLREMLARD